VTEFNLPPAAYIRLDLSPATLTSPLYDGGKLEKQRIIVTDAYVYVFSDAPGGPVLSYTYELQDFSGRSTIGYTLTVDDGDTIHVQRSTGCLCGSMLRGLRPFPGVPHIGSA
jgi:hypothetical protein